MLSVPSVTWCQYRFNKMSATHRQDPFQLRILKPSSNQSGLQCWLSSLQFQQNATHEALRTTNTATLHLWVMQSYLHILGPHLFSAKHNTPHPIRTNGEVVTPNGLAEAIWESIPATSRLVELFFAWWNRALRQFCFDTAFILGGFQQEKPVKARCVIMDGFS